MFSSLSHKMKRKVSNPRRNVSFCCLLHLLTEGKMQDVTEPDARFSRKSVSLWGDVFVWEGQKQRRWDEDEQVSLLVRRPKWSGTSEGRHRGWKMEERREQLERRGCGPPACSHTHTHTHTHTYPPGAKMKFSRPLFLQQIQLLKALVQRAVTSLMVRLEKADGCRQWITGQDRDACGGALTGAQTIRLIWTGEGGSAMKGYEFRKVLLHYLPLISSERRDYAATPQMASVDSFESSCILNTPEMINRSWDRAGYEPHTPGWKLREEIT